MLKAEGGKTDFSLSEKIIFWKRYRNVVKTKLQSKRNANIRQMKDNIMNGKIVHALYLMIFFLILTVYFVSFLLRRCNCSSPSQY